MSAFRDRTGEIGLANNGMQMKIKEYRGSGDIDIEFEDGTVVIGKTYTNFKNGSVSHPNIRNVRSADRTGEVSIARNGMKMKIKEYRGSVDIDVEFEDGTIVVGKTYTNFKMGDIANPNSCNTLIIDRTGEVSIARNGMKMKIKEYRSSDDIDIEFEDGTVVIGKDYYNFKKGNIANPNSRNTSIIDRTGEVSVARNGMKMRIKEYRVASDIDIQFEDGTVVIGKDYYNFKAGRVANPRMQDFYGYNIKTIAYKIGSSVYYVCEKDNGNEILTLQEIMKKQGIKSVF